MADDGWAWANVGVSVIGLLAGIGLASDLTASTTAVPLDEASGLGLLLFLGSAVHVASTSCLAVLPEVRSVASQHRGRYCWAPVGLMGSAALMPLLVSPAAVAWVVLAVLAWQLWHFQKQNVGVVALAAASQRLPGLRRGERRALKAAGAAGVVGLLARPRLVGLDVRFPGGQLWWVVGLALLVLSAAHGLAQLTRRPAAARPAGFSALYALSLLIWAPLFAFGSAFSAVGGITIAHGLQYLLLVGLALAGDGPRRWIRPALALTAALVGGAVLSRASHLHGSTAPLPRALFGAYLGILMSHFVVDAGLWRLSDRASRRFLAARLACLLPS